MLTMLYKYGRLACWVAVTLTAVTMLASAGCSGRYNFTVPEQVAPVGGEAPIVVRLNRSEVGTFAPAVKDAAIQFRIDDGPIRAAYTDKDGFAAAMVPVPGKEGQYFLSVYTCDKDGRQAAVYCPVFVFDVNRQVVAVDLEMIYSGKLGLAADAKAVMDSVATKANIVYLTTRDPGEFPRVRMELKSRGLPDGALLTWERQQWYMDNSGQFPRMIVANRLVSPLSNLRQTFKAFDTAICQDDLSARAFASAGLNVIVIGSEKVSLSGPKIIRYASWGALAAKEAPQTQPASEPSTQATSAPSGVK